MVVGDSSQFRERLGVLQNAVGAVPSPFDCFLILLGRKTLSVRMERHSENARFIAEWLERHALVERVYYPGLPSHPQYALAARQMKIGGEIITMVVKGGLESSRNILERVKVFSPAETLGGVESLIEHPAIMTHASIPRETREKIGIVDGLIRPSVGIEDRDDLIDDLRAEFESASAG